MGFKSDLLVLLTLHTFSGINLAMRNLGLHVQWTCGNISAILAHCLSSECTARCRARRQRVALAGIVMQRLTWGLCVSLLCVVQARSEPLSWTSDFEDAECLHDFNGVALHSLLNDLADILDSILLEPTSEAWQRFVEWRAQHGYLVRTRGKELLSRASCEVGKIAVSAACCTLLLNPSLLTQKELVPVLVCVNELEEMLLQSFPADMTPETVFTSRVHSFLHSAWPALRLLDSLVRLGPNFRETHETMRGCTMLQDTHGNEHGFDWKRLKGEVTKALTLITSNPGVTALKAED
eukprot:1119588-Amphidinium_carterae.1